MRVKISNQLETFVIRFKTESEIDMFVQGINNCILNTEASITHKIGFSETIFTSGFLRSSLIEVFRTPV